MTSAPQPPASRVGTWLERVGTAVVLTLVYVVWGLLNGYDLYALAVIPLVLGNLGGFLMLVLWLSEKVHGGVVALVYVGAISAIGYALWMMTGERAVVAAAVVPVGVMGLVFLAAAVFGREGEGKKSKMVGAGGIEPPTPRV